MGSSESPRIVRVWIEGETSMSEMLANRYFASGRYEEAQAGLEAVLRRRPGHLGARKKLVMCYVQTGRLREALDLALGLMEDAPEAFAPAGPNAEDLPCRSVLGAFAERGRSLDPGSYHAGLGVLQLFCDAEVALSELDRAAEEDPSRIEIRALRAVVRKHLEAKHVR
jgi:tetratricopeptide (TPR) repeat protein